ncbi:MAG TPA: helix-turn-helix transcriptional regulator [Galbitalea sp.]|jgi:transcriptional regulator with XRE-family HTH domain
MGTKQELRTPERVEQMRVELGIPMVELAQKTLIPRSTLQRKIRDIDELSVSELRRISDVYGVSVLSWFEDAA